MSHTFTPRTPEELDLCLRMLIEAKVSYDISLEEEKDEDEEPVYHFHIKIESDGDTVEKLKKRFHILTA